MIGEIRSQLLRWVSDPAAFWLIYGTILFCCFLLLVGTVENLILKKPINAFLMGVLFAAFMYLGIHWGKNIAPSDPGVVWQFGVQPTADSTCPLPNSIKGVLNSTGADRCTYYLPDASFYNQTKPDRCYARREEAMADGCRPPNL